MTARYPRLLPALGFAALALVSSPALAGYVVFDQTTDTIQIPGNTVLGNAMTIEARIRFCSDVISANLASVLFTEQYNGLEDKALTAGYTGMGGSGYNGSNNFFQGDVQMSHTDWHHVAYVVGGGTERLYYDGTLLTSRAWTGSLGNSALSAMSVGAFKEPAGGMFLRSSFLGEMDAFRMSSVARYSGNTFTPPAGDFTSDGSTLTCYNFNESPGSTTVIDSSPNGWNGTFGTGFAGATSPVIPATVNTCRFIRTMRTATAHGTITIETFSKPDYPRRLGPASPATLQTVHVTVPSGSTQANTTILIADSLTAQLGGGFNIDFYSSNIVEIHSDASFTFNIVNAVPGQDVAEVPEPGSAATVPTLSEWGMALLTLVVLGSGVFILRRRRTPFDPGPGDAATS